MTQWAKTLAGSHLGPSIHPINQCQQVTQGICYDPFPCEFARSVYHKKFDRIQDR
jgi:hypothetical protein